jgi:hypothetical protein
VIRTILATGLSILLLALEVSCQSTKRLSNNSPCNPPCGSSEISLSWLNRKVTLDDFLHDPGVFPDASQSYSTCCYTLFLMLAREGGEVWLYSTPPSSKHSWEQGYALVRGNRVTASYWTQLEINVDGREMSK